MPSCGAIASGSTGRSQRPRRSRSASSRPSTTCRRSASRRRASGRTSTGAAPATVNRELAALKRRFSLAVKSEDDSVRLTHRPYIPMLDESDNVREGFVEPAEFAALCAALPDDVADLVAFAYHTAWRRAEVVGLEWARVTVERGPGDRIARFSLSLTRSQTKNKRARTLVVAAGSALFAVLERRLTARHPGSPLVFHRNGRPVRDFRGAWAKACGAVGLHGQLFHDLRRSAIRNMVRAGVNETVARSISGHRTRSIFDRYNVSDERDLEQAVLVTDAYTADRQGDRRIESLDAHRRKAVGQKSDS
jgi:integrase